MIRKLPITLSALLAVAALVLILWGHSATAELDLTRGKGIDRAGPVFHIYDGHLLLNLHGASADVTRWPRWHVAGALTVGVGQAMVAVPEQPRVQQILPIRFVEVRIWCVILPFLLFAAWPMIAFVRGPYRRYRRRNKGLCLKCGYSLEGNLTGVCPECGEKI